MTSEESNDSVTITIKLPEDLYKRIIKFTYTNEDCEKVVHAVGDGEQVLQIIDRYKAEMQEIVPCEDWYDVPSDEMTLEQARQAVKDLRNKLAEYYSRVLFI